MSSNERERFNTNVTSEQGKMSEREVRDSVDRAAKRLQGIQEMNGNGAGNSVEKNRQEFQRLAERDHREGKI